MIAAIGAAAIGATVFMFATATPKEDGEDAAAAPEIGETAYLTPTDEDAWADVTASARVGGCVDSDGRYLVLVEDYAEEIYTVRTLPRSSTCQVWQFDVHGDIADINVIAKPRKATITYSPAPVESPSN